MKSFLMRIWHFLGGVRCAIFLIATTAIFVIIGTVLESKTDSHLFASKYVYSNPVFCLLLAGFFVNILISALRRWPFKSKHIPFLITHLGLLMILAGAIIKLTWGLQGIMLLAEGTASQTVLLPGTFSLEIQSHAKKGQTSSISLTELLQGKIISSLDAEIALLKYHPHALAQQTAWIHENLLRVKGLPPLVVSDLDDLSAPLPISAKLRFTPYSQKPLEILAFNTDISEIDEKVKLDNPEMNPRLLFTRSSTGETKIAYYDEYGAKEEKTYPQNKFERIVSYEEGFGGYFAQHAIHALPFEHSEVALEKANLYHLEKGLREALLQTPELSPPLAMLQNACRQTGIDFTDCTIAFLDDWNKTGGWLYESNRTPTILEQPLSHLDWSTAPTGTLNACLMTCALLDQIEDRPGLQEETLLYPLTQQLFMFANTHSYPNNDQKHTSGKLLSAFFRNYGLHLKQLISPPESDKEQFQRLITFYKEKMKEDLDRSVPYPIILESLLKLEFSPTEPLTKMEENRPFIKIWVGNQRESDEIELPHEQGLGGLRWPILGGKYTLRFQTERVPLPYRIRLRNAQRTNYAGSNQPMSYASDLLVKDIRTGEEKEVTISMNNVHETWEGHRFYLANISPSDDTDVHHVQIAVNYDPAKYWLTYPGAVVLSIGIVSLFWLRKKRKQNRIHE